MKLTISGDEPFGSLTAYLTKQLGLRSDERLFLYVDSAFSPVPTEPLDHLFKCFGQGSELVVNYSTIGAYG